MALNSGKQSTGFTLLEILVSVALLAVVVLLLASVFSVCERSWVNLSASARQRQDARSVLATMAKELRAANLPLNRSYEEAAPANRQPQLLINPQGVDVSLQNAHSVFWEASIHSSKGGSGLVGYFVRWEVTNQGPRPRLCRIFLSADEMQPVLAALRSGTNSEWITMDLLSTYAPGDSNSGFAGWMADNVLALYARALDPNMNPITNYPRQMTAACSASGSYISFGSSLSSQKSFDSRRGYQYLRISDGVHVDRFGPAFPAAVELVLLAAPPKEICKLTAIPTQVSSDDPSKLFADVDQFIAGLPSSLRNSVRVYSTIVPMGPQQ
jgi:prepilin-type N-terminal cleavage/methylation domain-containing protein